jgi:predicted DNA-binding transcriptional regulator AlpA
LNTPAQTRVFDMTIEGKANGVALDPVLSEKQLLEWLGVSSPTASRWRASGEGPPFVQLGPRRIGYRRSAVEGWLDGRECKRHQAATAA